MVAVNEAVERKVGLLEPGKIWDSTKMHWLTKTVAKYLLNKGKKGERKEGSQIKLIKNVENVKYFTATFFPRKYFHFLCFKWFFLSIFTKFSL